MAILKKAGAAALSLALALPASAAPVNAPVSAPLPGTGEIIVAPPAAPPGTVLQIDVGLGVDAASPAPLLLPALSGPLASPAVAPGAARQDPALLPVLPSLEAAAGRNPAQTGAAAALPAAQRASSLGDAPGTVPAQAAVPAAAEDAEGERVLGERVPSLRGVGDDVAVMRGENLAAAEAAGRGRFDGAAGPVGEGVEELGRHDSASAFRGLASDLGQGVPSRRETPASLAAAALKLGDDGAQRAMVEFYQEPYDLADLLVTLREVLGRFGPFWERSRAGKGAWELAAAGTKASSLRGLSEIFDWGGLLPKAQTAGKYARALGRLIELHRLGYRPEAIPAGERRRVEVARRLIEGEDGGGGVLGRLSASGITWQNVRIVQMILFRMALDTIRASHPEDWARLSAAPTISEAVLAELGVLMPERDARAKGLLEGTRYLWMLTTLLMLRAYPGILNRDGEPGLVGLALKRMERNGYVVSERKMSLPSGAAAEAVAGPFSDFLAPSPDPLAQFMKARGVLVLLREIMRTTRAKTLLPTSHPAYPFLTAGIEFDPASPEAPVVLPSPPDLAGVLRWGDESRKSIWEALRQAQVQQRRIDLARAGRPEEALAEAERLRSHGVQWTHTLMLSMVYYYAAIKSITDPGQTGLAADLMSRTIIPYSTFEDLARFWEAGVINNSTALGRFLYLWKVTQLLLIADPHLKARRAAPPEH